MASQTRLRLHSVHRPTFEVSPIVEWLHAMDLVAMAGSWGEGFADWVYETRRSLPAHQLEELMACNAAVPWDRLLSAVCRNTSFDHDFAWLSHEIRRRGEEFFLDLVPKPLVERATAGDLGSATADLLEHFRAVASYMEESPEAIGRLVAMLRDPAPLMESYLHVAEALLDEFLLPRWEVERPLLEREVEAQGPASAPATLPAWIERLTGRTITIDASCDADREIVAIPSRLLGPFVTLSQLDTDPPKLLMIYGPRTRSASMPAPLAAMTAASGFKALGEETRLRIVQLTATQEMYAHEIGLEFDQLGQPAISRHLRHLAAEGFLNVREAQAKKFYSLNRHRVRGLLMQMETLLAASEPDPERKV